MVQGTIDYSVREELRALGETADDVVDDNGNLADNKGSVLVCAC